MTMHSPVLRGQSLYAFAQLRQGPVEPRGQTAHRAFKTFDIPSAARCSNEDVDIAHR